MLNDKCVCFLNVQWIPLLLVISIFACKNMHSVALGLVRLENLQKIIIIIIICMFSKMKPCIVIIEDFMQFRSILFQNLNGFW